MNPVNILNDGPLNLSSLLARFQNIKAKPELSNRSIQLRNDLDAYFKVFASDKVRICFVCFLSPSSGCLMQLADTLSTG